VLSGAVNIEDTKPDVDDLSATALIFICDCEGPFGTIA